MREYETVFITNPDLSQSHVAIINAKITDIIEKQGGKLFFARDMGSRSLAYPIQKFKKGIYTCLDYAAAGDAVSQLERLLRLDETVLRFLTVMKNQEVDVEARAAEIAARGEAEAASTSSTENFGEESAESHGEDE